MSILVCVPIIICSIGCVSTKNSQTPKPSLSCRQPLLVCFLHAQHNACDTSSAGAATSIIFVVTSLAMFVMSCHDKSILVMTKLFVATQLLSRQKFCLYKHTCHDKRCVLLRQTHVCCDKHKTFVMTKLCLSQQIFVMTKIFCIK